MRAAFALVEVGLPGVERLRQLEASLAAPLRDAVGPYIASAKSEIDHFEPARTGSPVARILADAHPQTAALPTLREYVALDVRPPDVSAIHDDLLVEACADAIRRIERP